MLEEKGYSEDGYSRDENRTTYGSSYAGRKRDSIGRYSRDGSREHMLSKLEDMMLDADSEKTRSAIRKCINEIERN